MAQQSWLSVQDALQILLSTVSTKPHVETRPIMDALHRVASRNVIAPTDVPPCDNSAMDGYAMHAADAEAGKSIHVVATIFAGDSKDYVIQPGQCARIMTGAPVPLSCDTVVIQEDVIRTDNHITIKESARPGDNIRLAGADIKRGNQIIAEGTRLAPSHLCLLSSLGIASVEVYCTIKVGLMATGDELRPAGQPLQKGQIYESNRAAVSSLLNQYHVNLIDYGIVPDDPQAIKKTLETASKQCDLVISSGGVSVGDADFVKDILAELGNVSFWKIAMKPGKPFAFGHLNHSLFCGLPGNPVSAYVTTEQLVAPLVRQMQGEQVASGLAHRQQLPAVVMQSITRRAGRLDFQRAKYWVNEQGQLCVSAHEKQSSGVMTGIVEANCYLLVAPEKTVIHEGEVVMIQPFSINLT